MEVFSRNVMLWLNLFIKFMEYESIMVFAGITTSDKFGPIRGFDKQLVRVHLPISGKGGVRIIRSRRWHRAVPEVAPDPEFDPIIVGNHIIQKGRTAQGTVAWIIKGPREEITQEILQELGDASARISELMVGEGQVGGPSRYNIHISVGRMGLVVEIDGHPVAIPYRVLRMLRDDVREQLGRYRQGQEEQIDVYSTAM